MASHNSLVEDVGHSLASVSGLDKAICPTLTATSEKKSNVSSALSPSGPQAVTPPPLIGEVLDEVRAEHSAGAPGIGKAQIRMSLEQLGLRDLIVEKEDIGAENKKEAGDHRFWATQPVPQLGEGPSLDDGDIEPSRPLDQVRQDPYSLPNEFQWCIVDVNDEKQLKELHELLSENYVEHDDAFIRLQYSAEFLTWALKPPGHYPEWHVGVRVSSNNKLVAFISGVPITLRVKQNVVHASEINFLCVHKKLRSKRLAPVLIKEVTRKCHLKGLSQAIYTAGVVLPTPVSTCRYYHRLINVPKLVDIKFTYVPRQMTLARLIRSNKLAAVPHLGRAGSGGLREMEDRDISQVGELYTRYMQRFGMAPVLTLAELRHQFLGGKGRRDKPCSTWKGRREGQVVWTYVVEDPRSQNITDFFSFYTLPSTVIGNPRHSVLETAHLFCYATEVAFYPNVEDNGRLKRRLQDLIGDALIIADQAKFDVFNALTLMDNSAFLQDLKFGSGDGFLNYYLYNWRTAPLAGVEAVGDVPAGRGIGVVML